LQLKKNICAGYVDVPIVNGFVADVAESKLQRKKSMIESNPEDMADRDRDGMKSNAYIAGLFIREALIETKNKDQPMVGLEPTNSSMESRGS
jgi:cobyrinic acid a,c-diamide synthase